MTVELNYTNDLEGIIERFDKLASELHFSKRNFTQLTSTALEMTNFALGLGIPAELNVKAEFKGPNLSDFSINLKLNTTEDEKPFEGIPKDILTWINLMGAKISQESNSQMYIYSCYLKNITCESNISKLNVDELKEQLRYTDAEMISLKRAQAVERVKSQFVANMSHELRTPLNSIIGFSEMLEDGIVGDLENQQKDVVNDILGSAKHLLNLINEILDISKVEAGKMNLSLIVDNLKIICDDTANQVSPQLTKNKIKLNRIYNTDRFMVEVDTFRIKQVLLNLLSNAIKFSPIDSEIDLVVDERDSDTLMVSIKDRGIGIRKDDFGKIFKEFSQVDESHTRRYQGTGLGLALSKKLIDVHNGMIWFDSEYGKGTTFTFTLPRKQNKV
jgi:signal transduction histidine kinase